jgi:DNA-directed RNA polymerase specialized sigma24 family protein
MTGRIPGYRDQAPLEAASWLELADATAATLIPLRRPARGARGTRPPLAEAPAVDAVTALRRLIDALAADREVAGRRYEALRGRLVFLFRSRGCAYPEELADEALDRVGRRLAGGVEILDVVGYTVGVAQHLAQEARRRDLRSQPFDDAAAPGRAPDPDEAEDELAAARRLRCLECCLGKLAPDDRQLLVSYMQDQGATRIRARARMAEEMAIGMNALRIRVHRLRAGLERLVRSCCQSGEEQARRI